MTIDDIEGEPEPRERRRLEESADLELLHAAFHQLYGKSLKEAEDVLARLNRIKSN
jgi:hypothetical protein